MQIFKKNIFIVGEFIRIMTVKALFVADKGDFCIDRDSS